MHQPTDKKESNPWFRSEQPLSPGQSNTETAFPSVDSELTTPERVLLTQLEAGLVALNLDLASIVRVRLTQFLSQLIRWNKTFNLTAIRDPAEMVRVHLLDSLSLVPLLERLAGSRPIHLMDVGAGAGLPGIPLALALPGVSLTLVETSGKKAAFLRQIQSALQLNSTQVCQSRIEALPIADLVNGPVDILVCRAFRAMDQYLELVASVVSPNTIVVAMKGPAVEEELAVLQLALEQETVSANVASLWHDRVLSVEPLKVPGLDVQRNVVVLTPRSVSG